MSGEFIKVASLHDLEAKGKMVIKGQGKQILLIKSEDKILACNNRCPHEGFPLSEGSLSSNCVLTCNWHNWKFDLLNGKTLVGGDQLRLYPTKISGDDILLDLTDPPKDTVIKTSLNNLKDSFQRQDYTRMAREISRLEKVGGDPLDAIRQAIIWTHDRFEFGMTHAFAATADWIAARDIINLSVTERLVPIIEAVGHISWDSLRQQSYPFTADSKPFDASQFEQAIEDEDEDLAISLLSGALSAQIDTDIIFKSLACAALAHYADFGHAAIYVYKAQQLIDRLGPSIAEPVLKTLVRGLIYASREDLLPEFKQYSPTLKQWDDKRSIPDQAFDIHGKNVNAALKETLKHSGEAPEILYAKLLKQAARNMLLFDMKMMDQWDNSVSNNMSWLDFSHALTFANAVRNLCQIDPSLWPQALLQMACFAGRNSGFLDRVLNVSRWYVSDVDDFFDNAKTTILDHGNPEFIVSSHLIKIITAVEHETRSDPNAVYSQELLAGANRFFNSPFKRKHTRRVAHQAMEFVAREG